MKDRAELLAVARAWGTTFGAEQLAIRSRYVAGLAEPVRGRIERRWRETLDRHGASEAVLARLHARVAYAAILELEEIMVQETGDPACMLRAGLAAGSGDWGLYGHLRNTAATVGDNLEVGCEYAELMWDWAEMHLERRTDSVVWKIPGRASLESGELGMGSCLVGCQQQFGLRAPFVEIWMRHPAPAHASRHRELLRCPVRYEQACDAIVVSNETFALKAPGADAGLHRILRQHADDTLARVRRQNRRFSTAVCALIQQRLQEGAPSIDELAEALAVSASTLGRRLAREGHSVLGLTESVRRQEATRLLAETRMDVSEIARAVGFAHATTFHRAFRRWHGKAPLQYRQSAVLG